MRGAAGETLLQARIAAQLLLARLRRRLGRSVAGDASLMGSSSGVVVLIFVVVVLVGGGMVVGWLPLALLLAGGALGAAWTSMRMRAVLPNVVQPRSEDSLAWVSSSSSFSVRPSPRSFTLVLLAHHPS
jgi:hypothetical protein